MFEKRRLPWQETIKRETSINPALYDSLTKLGNKEYLEHAFRALHSKVATLLRMDLDNFTQLNSFKGHAAGDVVLAEAADVIKRYKRDFDILGRWGGAEFMLLLPDTSLGEAYQTAEMIRCSLAAEQFSHTDSISISIGLAERLSGETDEKWQERAGDALFRAKNYGRNKTVIWIDNSFAKDKVLGWKEEWSSGNKVIDDEHLRLLGLGNELLDLMHRHNDKAEIEIAWNEILMHLSAHFANEEEILHNIGYIDFHSHVNIHQRLIKDVSVFGHRLVTQFVGPEECYDFIMENVVTGHLIKEDTRFFPFTRAGSGVSNSSRALSYSIDDLDWTESILQNMPIAVVIMDEDYNIVYSNPYVLQLTGFSREEIQGKKCFAFFGDGTICQGCNVKKCIETKQILNRTKIERDRTGNEKYVEIAALPLPKKKPEDKQMVIEYVIDRTKEFQLQKQREEDYIKVIETLSVTLESRDAYTANHSSRMAEFCKKIGTSLSLPEEFISKIEKAALLHDIGKIGIPDRILLKPDKLTTQEYEIIKKHPEIGASILGKIASLKEVSEMVLSHHERYDGLGYPQQLSHEDINLGARILAVADCLEAMTSDRPYRSAKSTEEALAEIQREAGRQFDPKIVQAAVQCF